MSMIGIRVSVLQRWSCKRNGCYIRVCAMSNRSRGWADLPSGLLDSIISRLGSFHDLLAFQATCRPWHAVFSSCPFKYNVAALFPPLLLQHDGSQCSPHPHSIRNFTVTTRPCRVTDIANKHTTYQGFQIPIVWNSHGENASSSPMENFYFSGASYGHLIFSSNKSCAVFDVFTGVTVSSPQLPVLDEGTRPIYGALTAPLASANSYLIIKVGSQNLFWRVGSHSWVARSPRYAPIKQIIVLQGQVFGMDSDRRLFKLQLMPQQIKITELPVRESSMITNRHLSNTWLVTCGEMLLLVGFREPRPGGRFKVFRLDLSTDPALWLKMEKLENWAIFISKDERSQTLSCMNPERWGGRSNHIYCYDSNSKRCITIELGNGSKFNPNAFALKDWAGWVQPMWVVPSMFSLQR
uniref:Uncharacterized protein n=1 Tax=Aegilops tauschii TaxID=37682 RepID=M8BQR0_AEGTA